MQNECKEHQELLGTIFAGASYMGDLDQDYIGHFDVAQKFFIASFPGAMTALWKLMTEGRHKELFAVACVFFQRENIVRKITKSKGVIKAKPNENEPETKDLSEVQIADLQSAFESFDDNDDGTIEREKLKDVMEKWLGRKTPFSEQEMVDLDHEVHARTMGE